MDEGWVQCTAAVRAGDKFRLLCVIPNPRWSRLEQDRHDVRRQHASALRRHHKHGRVRFVIALKTNGPLRFELLHAIEAGL